MGLLSEIQESLLTEGSSLGPILLKLKFLASRIGSNVLEDWVQHEVEGYPSSAPVPEYRRTGISYIGTFLGYTNVMNEVPVPSALIKRYASGDWNHLDIRESISVVDEKLRNADKGDQFQINAADILFIIRDKIYQSHQC